MEQPDDSSDRPVGAGEQERVQILPRHVRVLGSELSPTYLKYITEHEAGGFIPSSDLADLVRGVLLRSTWRDVRGRHRELDRYWLQARFLEFVDEVCWYYDGPRLRLMRHRAVDQRQLDLDIAA